MIKYLITLCLLFQITQNNLCGQEIKPSFEYADFNFEIQNYKAALKEYLRIYYFDRENKHPDITSKIANCFLLVGDSKNAVKYYQYYLGQKKNYSQDKQDVFYDLIKAIIQNKSYKLALSKLFQCDFEIIAANSDRYYYFLGMTYLLDTQMENADKAFQKLSYYDLIDENKYHEVITDFNKNLKRNHRHAKIWSAIIPGLGQSINHDVRDGLNSFAINGSMIIIFIELAKSLSLSDAIITVVPWFGRFYFGGLKKAALASKRYQQSKTNELSQDIIQLVENASRHQ